MRTSLPFHKLLKKYDRCLAISALGNIDFQHFVLMVDGSPNVICLAIDLYEDFVKMPFPVRIILRSTDPFLTNFAREQCAKFIPSIAHSLVVNVDTPFMK